VCVWFSSTFLTCASLSKTVRVVHAWWAPPHFLHDIRQHLNQTFSEQWIGFGGPVKWPAWFSGHNPLDFSSGDTKRLFSVTQWLRGIIIIMIYLCVKKSITSSKTQDIDNIKYSIQNAVWQWVENAFKRLKWNEAFWQGAHPCGMKIWKLFWNAWELHWTSAIETTRTSPYINKH
jgi:hypothetical protein